MTGNLRERNSDELTLMMVRMRASGKSPSEIGRRIGKASRFVSTATNRVRKADQECGDDLKEVNAGYW